MVIFSELPDRVGGQQRLAAAVRAPEWMAHGGFFQTLCHRKSHREQLGAKSLSNRNLLRVIPYCTFWAQFSPSAALNLASASFDLVQDDCYCLQTELLWYL